MFWKNNISSMLMRFVKHKEGQQVQEVRVFLANHKVHVDVARYKKVFFFLTQPLFQLLYVKFCNSL